jgi:uncharacterized protein (TIRG00374 family)
LIRHHLIKAIGLILLLVIIASVDLGQVVHHLRNSDYRYLIPVVFLIIPQVALRALRWQRLMAQQGIKCPFRLAFMFYFAAIYIGLITPGRMGELAKCYFIKQNAIASVSRALPSVLIDRVLDLYFLGVLALAALYHIGLLPVPPWAAVLVVVAAGVLPWLILKWPGDNNGPMPRIGTLLSRVATRWGDSWFAVIEGAQSLLSPRLIEAILLTAFSYAVYFWQTCLIGRAIGIPLDCVTIAMVVAIGILIGYVPITIAGLGTREVVLIYFFGRFGITAASALSFAFLYNLVYIVCVGIISAIFWMKLPNRQELKNVQKDLNGPM